MFFKSKNKKIFSGGFLLVEMIVYVIMITLITTVIVRVMVAISSSYGNLRGSKAVISSAQILLNRFNYEVKGATNLDGDFGSTSGVLNIYNGATTTSISLSSGRVIVSVNGNSDYLTSNEVFVTKLTFYKLQATSTSLGVTMQVSMRSSSDPKLTPQNFQSTVLLRKSIQ